MIKCELIFLIVFFLGHPDVTEGQECSCDSPNVRTAIYKPVDYSKECWNQEETAILFARMVMQELMPKDIPLDVPILLKYFKLCLETVKAMSPTPKSHYIMVTAMSDVIGGYLRSFGLPTAKRGYYEGVVEYNDIKQLYELYDGILSLMGSDGNGWLHPFVIQKYGTVTPLPIVNQEKSACGSIVTYKCIDAVDRLKDCGINSELVPKPFLDNPNSPTAIAVPFSEKSLFGLNSNKTTTVLVDYFVTVTKCLKTIGNNTSNPCLEAFNQQFQRWLTNNVLPRINDETWYPGFGSILRVVESLKLLSDSEGKYASKGQTDLQDSHDHPSIDIEHPSSSDNCGPPTASIWIYIGILALILVIFWVVVCCVCICLKKRKKCKPEPSCDGTSACHSSATGPVLNTLVDLYCDSDLTSGKSTASSAARR